jgi:hypothetical protein
MALGQPIFQENDTTDQHAIILRQFMKDLYGSRSGVLNTGGVAVAQRGAGANMSVDVALGGMLIPGTVVTAQGFYYDNNDATVNVPISASNPSNPRNTLIIAQVRDAFYSGVNNDALLVAVDGTPAGSPADPDLNALGYTNYLVLARVVVGAGVTSITNANITNLAPQTVPRGGIQVGTSTGSVVSPAEGDHFWDSSLKRRWKRTGGAWVIDQPAIFDGDDIPDPNNAVALNATGVYQQMATLSASPARDCLAFISFHGTFNCVLTTGNFRIISRIQVGNADHPIAAVDNTFNCYVKVYSAAAGACTLLTGEIFWPMTAGAHTVDWDAQLTAGSAAAGEVRTTRIKCQYLDNA